MPLAPGTRIGPYEIVAPIGAGGMGEVYRARDGRLDRDVAIKVLPPSFADDPDRRARFEREAKAVAALSHSNILAIYDTGLHDGQLFVVTELLAGETLRERLTAGALPVKKAADLAVQIARGLAAAHDKAIVHRDLKPENVFLLADGQVKILDFGLARHTALSSSGGTETAAALTDPGMVMGTVGYMSPEQVRGQTIDARADLFALGAVLYEMLAGRRAFQRDTAAETMTAILREDPPDLTNDRSDLPPALERIVRHCLEKNPAERFQSARDIAFALDALSGSRGPTPSGAAAIAATPNRRAPGRRIATALAAVALAALAFWAGGQWTRRQPPGTPPSFTRLTFDRKTIHAARFMPDGREVIFSAGSQDGTPALYMVRMDSAAVRSLDQPRTHLLAVSRNRELLVLTGASLIAQRLYAGTLARMPVDGAPKALLEHVREADWAPDGEDMAIVRDAEGKDRLEYPVNKVLYETSGYVSDPRVSPDGIRVAFMDHQARYDDRGWVKVVDRSGVVTTLAGEYSGEEGLAWADDSTVVFSADPGNAQREVFSSRIDSPGHASTILPAAGNLLFFDVAPERGGSWLVAREDIWLSTVVLAPGQAAEREFTWRNNEWSASLSSGGRQFLFTDGMAGSNYGVAVRSLDDQRVKTLGEGDARGLSPDGRWALAAILSDGRIVLYPTGTGPPVRPNQGALRFGGAQSLSWYPDSAAVLACGSEPGRPSRCYRIAIGGGQPEPVTPEGVISGWVAPDGRRILGRRGDQTFAVFSSPDGPATPVPGLTSADAVFGWTSDGRAMFGGRPGLPFRLEKIDVTTGQRTLFKELGPADRNGVGLIGLYPQVSVLPDGRGYVYSYGRTVFTLYAVHGATPRARAR